MSVSVALVAHDAKKDEMAEFAAAHREVLGRFALFATGTTGGRVLERCPELAVTRAPVVPVAKSA